MIQSPVTAPVVSVAAITVKSVFSVVVLSFLEQLNDARARRAEQRIRLKYVFIQLVFIYSKSCSRYSTERSYPILPSLNFDLLLIAISSFSLSAFAAS